MPSKSHHGAAVVEPQPGTTNTPTQTEIVAPAASGEPDYGPLPGVQAGKPEIGELSAAEKQRIRSLVESSTGRRQGLIKMPDGSARMDVIIPVEIFLMLESQAECAGEPLDVFIQRNVTEALMAYVAAEAG